VATKSAVLPPSSGKVRPFGRTYCLHLKDQNVSQASSPVLFYSSILKMEAIYTSEHRAVSELHGVITQKTTLFN
jgi:hypothetical protein